MPFIHRLRFVNAPKYLGYEVRREANQCLNRQQDVGSQPKLAMDGVEVYRAMRKLIIFDDDKSSDHGVQGYVIDDEVSDSALALLVGSVCWLEEEDGFSQEENSTGVEKRVGRKEGQRRVEEDTGPDESCEEENASLRDDGGAYRCFVSEAEGMREA